jgi:hypothetical protein
MAPAQASGPTTRVASAAPNAQSDGFFSNLARKVGLGGTDTTATAQPVPAKPKLIEAKRNEPRPEASAPKAAAAAPPKPDTNATPKPDTKQAAVRPPLKPSLSDTPAAAAPAKDSLVAGSQPIVSSNSFDSRFSAFK